MPLGKGCSDRVSSAARAIRGWDKDFACSLGDLSSSASSSSSPSRGGNGRTRFSVSEGVEGPTTGALFRVAHLYTSSDEDFRAREGFDPNMNSTNKGEALPLGLCHGSPGKGWVSISKGVQAQLLSRGELHKRSLILGEDFKSPERISLSTPEQGTIVKAFKGSPRGSNNRSKGGHSSPYRKEDEADQD